MHACSAIQGTFGVVERLPCISYAHSLCLSMWPNFNYFQSLNVCDFQFSFHFPIFMMYQIIVMLNFLDVLNCSLYWTLPL